MDKSKFYYSDGIPFHGIFREIQLSGQYTKEEKEPLYTILEEDDDLPSAHRIYMESMNEYDAAMKLVPTWTYWNTMLKHSVRIRHQVESWREEKLLRDQARAKAMLWAQAEKGNISAQRVLYESKKEEAEQRRRQSEQNKRSQKEQSVLGEAFEKLGKLELVK